jgi:hypothetical protein
LEYLFREVLVERVRNASAWYLGPVSEGCKPEDSGPTLRSLKQVLYGLVVTPKQASGLVVFHDKRASIDLLDLAIKDPARRRPARSAPTRDEELNRRLLRKKIHESFGCSGLHPEVVVVDR